MAEKALHTIPAGEKALLPFHDLVQLLRLHGFSIRPDDYIEMLKVVERFGVQDIEELGSWLCPLIATSPEEQEKFYKVFDEYKKLQTPASTPPVTKRNWWWLWALLLMPLAFFIGKKIFTPTPLSADFTVTPVSSADDKYRVGDTVQLDASPGFNKNVADNNTELFWNTGKGFQKGAAKHLAVLEKEGPAIIQLKVRSKKNPVKDSVKNISLHVCPPAPPVTIPLSKTNFSIGEELTLQPQYASENRFEKIQWKINNEVVSTPTNATDVLRYRFDSAGLYQITFIGFFDREDQENSICTFVLPLESIAVNEEKAYKLQAITGGIDARIVPYKKIHPLVNVLLVVPALLLALLSYLWWKQKQKRKKEEQKEPPRYTGKKPPYETPLENKDTQLIQSENSFREIFRSFRQKAEDEIIAFNLTKSIQNTIRSGGVPELIYTHKMRYNDYVVLIDRNLAKSMQVHLFDYLVKLLNDEAISVERFYYTGAFEKVFNESVPDGYSLKRLSELYKSYTLIIMGDARQLVYTAYPMLEKNITSILHEWEHKAILTPVPFKEWGKNEKIISGEFVLLPADMQGQIKLIQAIREHQLNHKKYLSSFDQFYELSVYNFEEVEDIETYLNDEVLMQWVCAICVFHRLRWEIVIEIGKAICTRYQQPEKMNFTSLLKLSRISWMNEGSFPAATRLELLKKLTQENEVLARETLLRLLQYADTYFEPGYFFEEEKEVQQITSRFLLYAHDPQKFAAYKTDQATFQSLWEANQLWDMPQKAYLDNTSGNKWPTLIQHHQQSISISEYFDYKEAAKSQSAKKVLWRNGILAATLLLLLLILHLTKNHLPSSFFVQSIFPSTQSFSIVVVDSIECEGAGTIPSLNGSLLLQNGNEYPLSFYHNPTEYIAQVQIPYSNKVTTNGLLQLYWNNGGEKRTSAAVSMDKTTVTTLISACAPSEKKLLTIYYNDTTVSNSLQQITNLLVENGFEIKTTAYQRFHEPSHIEFFHPENKNSADSLANLLEIKDNTLFPMLPSMLNDSSAGAGTTQGMTLYINFDKYIIVSNFVAAALPGSLNEIWQGSTNNRLLTVDASRQIIYYSTGGKNTFGTYRTSEVTRNNQNVYKIITNADKQYATFFIRNVRPTSFELSVCANRYATPEEARAVDENSCGSFNAMTLYLDRDPSKAYFALRSSKLAAGQQDKLIKITSSVNNNTGDAYFDGVVRFNKQFPPKEKTDKTSLSNYLENMARLQSGQFTLTLSPFTGTPFDRGFIQLKASNQPIQKPLFKDSTITLLGVITFDEKNSIDDNGLKIAQSLLSTIKSLGNNKIKLVAYIPDRQQQRIAAQKMNAVQKILYLNTSQVLTETSVISYQPNQQYNSVSGTLINNVAVYEVNYTKPASAK